MRRVAVILLASLLLASGCAVEAAHGPESARTPQPSAAGTGFPFEEVVRGPITSVEYKPGSSMAILPSDGAEPAPCVVILHGYNAETAVYQKLAESVSEEGTAVFLPEWGDALPSGEDPRQTTVTNGLDDIADAMRFVRLHAERYGGDPERVVIVGHSLGGTFAMTTMLAGDRFGTGAFPREVNAMPDAYVSLDGVVPFRELLWTEELRRRYDKDPATWDKINPETYLSSAKVRADAPYRFFVATLDFDETSSLAARMNSLGHDASVERLEVGHMQAGEPQTATVEAITDLAYPD